jgi:hypothetical protein
METSSATEIDAMIQYMFETVFLPPKLPGNGDSVQLADENELLTWVQKSLDRFIEHVPLDSQKLVAKAARAIETLSTTRNSLGFVDNTQLLDSLIKLPKDCK